MQIEAQSIDAKTACKEILSRDPAFAKVFAKVGVLDFAKLKRPAYVAQVGAILGQKIKYFDASELRGKLFQRFGAQYTRRDLETLSQTDMEKMGFPERSIVTIVLLNQYLRRRHGDDYQRDFPKGAEKQRFAELQEEVDGIGPWTRVVALLTFKPDEDEFPVGDLFLQNKAQKLYALKSRPSEEELDVISRRWAPHRGIATWYLWRWFEKKATKSSGS